MEIRTYRAQSVHDALQMVRNDLGPDAVVLRTREVRQGGLLGLFTNQRCLEVTASIDTHVVGRWSLARGRLDRGIDLSETREPHGSDFETNGNFKAKWEDE